MTSYGLLWRLVAVSMFLFLIDGKGTDLAALIVLSMAVIVLAFILWIKI